MVGNGGRPEGGGEGVVQPSADQSPPAIATRTAKRTFATAAL